MNHKLLEILAAILRNVDALNEELIRLYRTEQFNPDDECHALIEEIRQSCADSLSTTDMVDRLLKAYPPPAGSHDCNPEQPK